MDREVIKQVIADQRDYTPPKVFYKRLQTEKIQEFASDPNIVIITGLRRSGKSTSELLAPKGDELPV